jgi:hypothetical protein
VDCGVFLLGFSWIIRSLLVAGTLLHRPIFRVGVRPLPVSVLSKLDHFLSIFLSRCIRDRMRAHA